jgi:predicted metal-dependent phosphoesterase TrpH
MADLVPSSRAPARGGADLHVHSTHSDGTLAPGDVVRAAAQAGLDAVAITDHDRLSAIAPARSEAARVGIELVPAIEVTARHEAHTVHLLGYFVDDADPRLSAAVDLLRAARAERFEALCRHVEVAGLRVDRAAIDRLWPRAALGRRHLATWLSRSGQLACPRDAFVALLADHHLPPLPEIALPAAEAIALVDAGGVSSLAHPPRTTTDAQLASLADLGLGALEVDWPGQSGPRVEKARLRARRLGLVPTAGSDFHAPARSGGLTIGARRAPKADLEALRARARAAAPCPSP